jgi:hypothetical protein
MKERVRLGTRQGSSRSQWHGTYGRYNLSALISSGMGQGSPPPFNHIAIFPETMEPGSERSDAPTR